jgi:hypothetical protein
MTPRSVSASLASAVLVVTASPATASAPVVAAAGTSSVTVTVRRAPLQPGGLRIFLTQPVVVIPSGATGVSYAALVACRPFAGLPRATLFMSVHQGDPAGPAEDFADYSNASRDPVRCDGRPHLVRSMLRKELLVQPPLTAGRAVADLSLVGWSADGHFATAGEHERRPLRVLVLSRR